MRCCICGRTLDEIGPYQPKDGTAFETQGHYGSAVTDHMDGTTYFAFVCDPCVIDGLTSRVIEKVQPSQMSVKK